MTIIVEDGSIVSGANSYTDYDELVAFGLIRGITINAVQEEGEAFLIEAMDAIYGRPWKGERVSIDQDLEHPRVGMYRDGFLLPHDEIASELKDGQLALAVAANEGIDLMPYQTAQGKGRVIEERVEGAITIKYASAGRVLAVALIADAEAFLRVLERRRGPFVIRA